MQKTKFTLADAIGRENVGVLFDRVSTWQKQRKQAQQRIQTKPQPVRPKAK